VPTSLASLARPELILPGLAAADRAGVLRALAAAAAAHGLVADAETLHGKLAERELLGSTAIGGGVAIPHCKLAGLAREVVAVAVARQGVDFGAADGEPVRLFFLVVSPVGSPAEHLRVLAAISRWVRTGAHVERILAAPDGPAIERLLGEDL